MAEPEAQREAVAQEIERFIRTPPGVEMSDVTKVYVHCAHIARTGHTHDAWTPCDQWRAVWESNPRPQLR